MDPTTWQAAEELSSQQEKQNFYAAYFRTRFTYDRRRDPVWQEVCRYLQQRYFPAANSVLDMGAGYCNFINHIQAGDKHALDLTDIIIQYANSDVYTHVQSCQELDKFDDDYFDVVFASNLFEHLSRREFLVTIDEARRVLRPGGKLIAIQPNFKYCATTYFDDYTHTQIFTDQSLCDLLRSKDLAVVDVKPRFLPVNMKSTLKLAMPRLDLIVRLYLRLPIRPLAGQMLVVTEKPAN